MPSIDEIAKDIGVWRREKGFYSPDARNWDQPPALSAPIEADLILGKLMLIVTEISEAAEAIRKGDLANFTEELADAVIRCLDLSDASGINIEEAIMTKMSVNKDRPFKHNKKTNL